jgi:uracil-DNA glycosylase
MKRLELHRQALLACRRCPGVHPQPVCHPAPSGAVDQITEPARPSRIYLIGQAPGPREPARGRPFAHTAGKTLFRWFQEHGVSEEAFRAGVYMAAVLRCFPGKASGGGDRVPSREEMASCRPWIEAELDLLRPSLIIPVGRLAIEQVLGTKPRSLAEVVGAERRVIFLGHEADCVPLPHPSGVSTWHKKEPGKSLLARALLAITRHSAWRATFPSPPESCDGTAHARAARGRDRTP